MNKFCIFAIFLLSISGFGQTISGIVRDLNTNKPIESAAVYFDQTTIGTSTDNEGKFEIRQNQKVKTPLVISYLGYKTVRIENYNSASFYKIFLEEAENELDQVVISVDEGMSRARKLEEFKREFLGDTKNGTSCIILNEDDLILRFNKKTKKLIASSYRPIEIVNKNLGYSIAHDIGTFNINYGYINPDKGIYSVKGVFYEGTSFFRSVEHVDKKIQKRRDRAYTGSILHFMRALRDEQLIERDYKVFSRGLIIQPDKYIQVNAESDSMSFKVRMRLPLSILYDNEYQTDLKPKYNVNSARFSKQNSIFKNGDTLTPKTIRALRSRDTISIKKTQIPYYNTTFRIDNFGNFSPPTAFSFSGHMGTLRLGDTLPLDYDLNTNR